MSTINLLILLGIIFGYCTIGTGVYMYVIWHDNAEWKDSEAATIVMIWPLVLILVLIWKMVDFYKWIWDKILDLK